MFCVQQCVYTCCTGVPLFALKNCELLPVLQCPLVSSFRFRVLPPFCGIQEENQRPFQSP
jgi:hypothetical protein